MRINAINLMTFGNRQQVAKKAAGVATAALASGLAADTFVKGISKPNEDIENEIIKGNDDGWNPCDPVSDEICGH